MFFKIVRETASADAFVARDVKVRASKRAIGEFNVGVGTVHPCAAEATAAQGDRSIAYPIPWIAILAQNSEVDCGRALPFPVAQKLV